MAKRRLDIGTAGLDIKVGAERMERHMKPGPNTPAPGRRPRFPPDGFPWFDSHLCAPLKFMTKNANIVRQFVEDVLNNGDIEATGKYFHEDVVEQVPLPGQGPGLKGLKDVLRGLRAAFPDMHWAIEEQIEEDDKVVSRFVWSGTHRAEFFGVPASGRRVSVWGVVIDRLVEGRIKDTRIIMDALGLMAQMGVFPPPNK